MKIIRAQTAGFCFGVRRAIDYVYQSIKNGHKGKIYTLGPIIHNPQVVNDLADKGVIVEEDINKIDDGLVIIRSHGAPPEVYERIKAKGVDFVDATCPYVARVHAKVKDYYLRGYQIIIIGEADHPEVIGTNGWCDNTAIIINSAEEARRLPPLDKVCVVAQTTLTQGKWDEILDILLNKADTLQVFNTICDATSRRQQEAQRIAQMADVVIVIGGKNSSNTRKLYELCKEYCSRTFLIESAVEIDNLEIQPDDVVGITAGASTPDGIIEEVIEKMSEISNNELKDVKEDSAVTEEKEVVGAQELAAQPVQQHNREEVDFARSIEKTLRPIHVGDMVKGKIVSITDNGLIVSIGGKQDGIIPPEHMGIKEGVNPADVFHVDDEIEAQVIKITRDEGDIVLSRRSIVARQAWADVEDAYNTGKNLEGVVKQVIKGGILLDINGIEVFVPASHVSDRYVKDLNTLIGQHMSVKIIEITPRRRRAVGSHKAVIEQEKWQREEQAWSKLQEGERVTGKVKNVTDFGAFVDVGGVDGLIHISDLSWGKIKHPSEVVKPGDTVEVVVLVADRDKKKLSLGLKQLQPQPWDYAAEKYKVGSVVTGKVVKIMSFGAFVELEPGLDGLVHISQIADRRINKVDDVLKIGDEVPVKIMDVRPEDHRISLSIKEAQENDNKNDQSRENSKGKRQRDDKSSNNAQPVVHEELNVTLGDIYPNIKDDIDL